MAYIMAVRRETCLVSCDSLAVALMPDLSNHHAVV